MNDFCIQMSGHLLFALYFFKCFDISMLKMIRKIKKKNEKNQTTKEIAKLTRHFSIQIISVLLFVFNRIAYVMN